MICYQLTDENELIFRIRLHRFSNNKPFYSNLTNIFEMIGIEISILIQDYKPYCKT